MNRSDRRALVTGVGGFLGRYIARSFAADGWEVVGVDRHALENAPLRSLKSYHAMQLPDPAFRALVEQVKPDILIHCAGRASVPQSVVNPAADFAANANLTFELLDTLRSHAPACKFVLLSSAAVYGNPSSLPVSEDHVVSPVSPYGFHKRISEQLIEEFCLVYGMRGASLRIFSAYGPGLRRQVVWDICHKILIEETLTLQGTGEETRDFIHAGDVARAVLQVTKNAPMIGETYNVASGFEISMHTLASLVLGILHKDLPIEFDGAVPPGSPRNWRADISKLRSLGFELSIPFKNGLESFASWSRAELVG